MTSTSTNMIEIRDLKKTYRVGEIEVHALRGADLTVARGEFVSVVGPSGSGKSTLFVFQKYNLLPTLSAADNIEIARHIARQTGPRDPQFDEMLTLLGLQGRLHHKPRALSGGEQQRVAIARALVNHPALLLADEPTGNLDTENSTAVLSLLRDLNARLGQTILMITHNPEAAAYGHRTVKMRDGRVV